MNPIKVPKVSFQSTAVQHVSKHFDMVVGLDVHWTKIPPSPIPVPLPHPFIGLIFDPMEYIVFDIPVPKFMQDSFNLPASLPMGGRVFVNGRHKATTTTSVFGLGGSIKLPPSMKAASAALSVAKVVPIKHITGGLPVYKIVLKDLEGPHDGEVYVGSQTVYISGSECSGDQPQQVLTCWGIPFGHQYFPPAWLALYQHIANMYIQFNFGKPVLVGGPFVPHQYSMSDILMRAATVLLMKGLTKLFKKGMTKFNHALQDIFGDNPVSKALCFFGLEPVNFATGAMNFEWDDFELSGNTPIRWTSTWDSQSNYSGFLGHGVVNSFDLFILPDFKDGVAAIKHPEENTVMPIPVMEVGAEEEYYRPLKMWQRRPNADTWIIEMNGSTYTYKSFPQKGGGVIYRAVKVEHADGSTLKLEYTLRNHILLAIKDQSGRRLDFEHDKAEERIISATYDNGAEEELLARYEYDERGNLVRVLDRADKGICFEYDGNDRVIHRTNRNGVEYFWKYDEKGRVEHTAGNNGFQEGIIHYCDGYNEVCYPGRDGKTERYYYNENNLVYKVVDGMGGETRYDYNAYNERTLTGTPEGRVSGNEYDEKGNVIKYSAPDGAEYLYKYDERNRLVRRDEPSGAHEEWEYDTDGRLMKWIRLDGSTVEYSYDEEGLRLPTHVKSGDKQEAELAYNGQGQVLWIKRSDGFAERRTYDSYGRITAQGHGNGTYTEWRRDAMGRVTGYSSPGQKKLRIAYDAYDLPVEVSNGSEVWTMEYTPMGSLRRQTRRTRHTMGVKSSLSYQYDKYEQLTSVVNEHGERYTFRRNLNDDIVAERGFDGGERRYERDGDGLITATLQPNGTLVCHDHDMAGRLVHNRYADGTWESYAYNQAGLLVKACTPDTQTVFTRDPLGRIIKEAQQGQSIDYAYDDMGNLTRLSSTLGADTAYEYDPFGYVKSITSQTGGARPWQAHMKTDCFGRESNRLTNSGVEMEFSYDLAGRPYRQQVQSHGRDTLLRGYRWDDDFRLAEAVNTLTGASVHYDYDAFGSLAAAHYGETDTDTEHKCPDEAGNIYRSPDRSDRCYAHGGQLSRDGAWHYYYDEGGNLILKTRRKIDTEQASKLLKRRKRKLFSFVAEDTPETTKTLRHDTLSQIYAWQLGDTAYTWHATGQLASVTLPEGRTVRYEYDALGRLTGKFDGNKKTHYLWSGNVLLHEWTNDDTAYAVTWVYNIGDYVPSARIQGGKSHTLISDYIGRAVQAYDEDGAKVWETDYDIYGNLHNLKGDRNFIPFRQLGQIEDEDTGLYYNRFRWYSADIGLYISQDPIRLSGGNPTMYGYVSDTNSWIDIFGLDSSGLTNGIPNNPGTVRRFMSKDEYKRFKKNGFKFDPADTRGGISATSTKIRPVNPDALKRSTGALGADYFVDINTEGLNVELKGKTKEGLPDWKIKDDVSTDRIVNSGRVKCK